jgi:hypothetical protein
MFMGCLITRPCIWHPQNALASEMMTTRQSFSYQSSWPARHFPYAKDVVK